MLSYTVWSIQLHISCAAIPEDLMALLQQQATQHLFKSH